MADFNRDNEIVDQNAMWKNEYDPDGAVLQQGGISGMVGKITSGETPAGKASQLATSRSISISGGATGTATAFNGTADITIPVTGLNMANANAGTLAAARGGTGRTDGCATPLAHNQAASTISAGTFTGAVKVPAGTDYTVGRVRNIFFNTSASWPSGYANGDILLVYTP